MHNATFENIQTDPKISQQNAKNMWNFKSIVQPPNIFHNTNNLQNCRHCTITENMAQSCRVLCNIWKVLMNLWLFWSRDSLIKYVTKVIYNMIICEKRQLLILLLFYLPLIVHKGSACVVGAIFVNIWWLQMFEDIYTYDKASWLAKRMVGGGAFMGCGELIGLANVLPGIWLVYTERQGLPKFS